MQHFFAPLNHLTRKYIEGKKRHQNWSVNIRAHNCDLFLNRYQHKTQGVQNPKLEQVSSMET